jgi:hypothetical protein
VYAVLGEITCDCDVYTVLGEITCDCVMCIQC